MKKFLILSLFAFLSILLFTAPPCVAIEDPLSLPNNKIGIHILFTDEIEAASGLINNNGGEWGYVAIPVQAGDRNLVKWQKFMDDCRKHHVIPILKLATEGDYFNTIVWRKPTNADVLDFANFLNSLEWPVKNRYIVIFNEVNRADEWGGEVNPEEYAKLLNYSVATFKSLSEDFFIISSGLDNAAPNDDGYMNEYDYMRQMDKAVPGIFGSIDGLGSHSYPNPGFKQLPSLNTKQNICSFNYEKDLANRLGNKYLPVFITETGWSRDMLSEALIEKYYEYAYKNVWTDESIVAVTPFLLRAGTPPFSQFSLIDGEGKKTMTYNLISEMPKIKGQPSVNMRNDLSLFINPGDLPEKIFSKKQQYENISMTKVDTALGLFRWFLKLHI